MSPHSHARGSGIGDSGRVATQIGHARLLFLEDEDASG